MCMKPNGIPSTGPTLITHLSGKDNCDLVFATDSPVCQQCPVYLSCDRIFDCNGNKVKE